MQSALFYTRCGTLPALTSQQQAKKGKMMRDTARYRKFLIAIFMMTLVIAPSVSQAAYYFGPCDTTWSTTRYETQDNSTTLYNQGHALGLKVAGGSCPVNTEVVLDFGGQYLVSGVWGTYGAGGGNPFMSDAGIAIAAEKFGQGFYDATPVAPTLTLGIGTTNSTSQVGTNAGSAWAGLVNSVGSWLANPNNCGSSQFLCSAQVFARGAIDAETEWYGPAATEAWANAYNTAGSYVFLDFGDAGSCPTGSYSGGNGSYCRQAGYQSGTYWYQGDVYNMSWGNPAALPLPEIYNTNGLNGQQWEMIAEYGRHYGNYGLPTFQGSLTQWQACNVTPKPADCVGADWTPSQGWDNLVANLANDPMTAQRPPFATDLTWSQNA